MGTGRVINVVLFASVREKAGCDSLEVECENCTIEELKQQLMAQGEHWQQALQGNILAAVDQEMVVDSFILKDHCEVAFFPPVTGG